jgi:predicted phosphodiesterase
MKTRFVGDCHGLKYDLAIVLQNLPEDVTEVIQVGDLGVGFGQGDYWHEDLDRMLKAANATWIRGNHDNPATCKEMSTWMPDGTVKDDWMFAGGAWSIDYAWRKKGVSWWEDEELSYPALEHLISIYDMVRPRVMVTHDVPHSVATQLFFSEGRPLYGKGQYKTRTGAALDAMFDLHRPDLWVFGHWHYDVDEVIGGTRFVCLNELSIADVNRETLEIEFSPAWTPLHEKVNKHGA